jgi:hypothetical protein
VRSRILLVLVRGGMATGWMIALPGHAQQQPIAYVPTEGVSLSGPLSVENGKASIGNNGAITAGEQTAHLTLARGGEVRLCASTKVHLSKDATANSNDPAADSALMIALDRGALEASYTPGKYSDVLLTPDLRILISGPGKADFKIRVNQQGDTCIDNHGADAPYVTVTSQFEGGLYRVQPNQRVLIEHGSLEKVIDNEADPCGCPAPPPVSVASATADTVTNKANPAVPGQKIGQPTGGPSSTAADTSFPLAVSEGLKPPPTIPTEPLTPAGVAHVEVQAPISYSGSATPNPAEPGAAGTPPPASATVVPMTPVTAQPAPPATQPANRQPEPKPTAVVDQPKIQGGPAKTNPEPQQAQTQIAQAESPKQSQGGFFHSIGHFFAKLFGR